MRPLILPLSLLLLVLTSCTHEATRAPAPVSEIRNVVLITIDTLRADHLGAYGYAAAHTATLDALAAAGARFDRAFATAPITLTSHASLMTGRYPPGHGARHNGVRMNLDTPTLAEAFARAGFATGGFVAAFPLDRRFGLIKGFHHYGDAMPRDANGRPGNSRWGSAVVDDALAWAGGHRDERIFLWVHLFEPHAPYGDRVSRSPASSPIQRYDDDIAEADFQVRRLLEGLGFDRAKTLIVVAGDHGEAFGEHGEVSHSVFAYDTTLRVPLIVTGAAVKPAVIGEPVSLVDVAPTILSMAGLGTFDADGRVIRSVLNLPPEGGSHERSLYSETFAPLLDFGWSPLRTIRSGRWKYIAAPKPELYDLEKDAGEMHNVIAAESARAADLARQVDAISPATLPVQANAQDNEARARLQALGYASGRGEGGGDRPDPKDRRELAAHIARVTSGELQGAALEGALREILRMDPRNPQANLRLGYVLLESGRCAEAIPRFTAAIEARLPSADAHLGRANCEAAAKNPAAAIQTLAAAEAIEPDNPVVLANLGLMQSDAGRPAAAIAPLQRALSIDPDLHQARFALAIAFARLARRGDAAREAEELLRRLPAAAPQRPEVERLLASVR